MKSARFIASVQRTIQSNSSIKQSIKQSTFQPSASFTTRVTSKDHNRSINTAVNSTKHANPKHEKHNASDKQPISQWTNPVNHQTHNQDIDHQTDKQSTNHSINQSINQSNHPSMSHFVTAAEIRSMRGFVIDMDGVLYHLSRVIPGALDFIAWLQQNNKEFLFLTNSSERSPRELQEKLARMGVNVEASHFYTSALATAAFLARQKPNGTAFVIGEPGLFSALYDVGYSMNDINPDYVVVGETRNYSYAAMEHAVKLVRRGARLIGTNCDVADRTQDSFIPACGALVKPIEMASGRQAYFIGKPNPLMMRAALSKLGISRHEACIVGDRMDTDILAGIQSEIRTVLVLTGVTAVADLPMFPYRPDCILPSLGAILKDNQEVMEQPVD